MINMVYDLIYRNNIGALVLLRDGPSSPIEKTVHQSDHKNHHMHEDGFYRSGYNTPKGNGDSFHPRIDAKKPQNTNQYNGWRTDLALRIYGERKRKKEIKKKEFRAYSIKRSRRRKEHKSFGTIKYRKYSNLFK